MSFAEQVLLHQSQTGKEPHNLRYYLSISVFQVIPRTTTFKVLLKLGSKLQYILQWSFMCLVIKMDTFFKWYIL